MTEESGQNQVQSQGQVADDLALAGTVLALDRTLLSWFRTSLSLIGFGFALDQIYGTDAIRQQNFTYSHHFSHPERWALP